ncbi:MAG: hypothetical protein ACOC8B_07030, partial [Gemmatimonadota bacterium]
MRLRRASGAAVLLTGVLGVAGAAASAAAQEPRHASFASAFVSPDHWAVAAVRRVEALGLAPRGFE